MRPRFAFSAAFRSRGRRWETCAGRSCSQFRLGPRSAKQPSSGLASCKAQRSRIWFSAIPDRARFALSALMASPGAQGLFHKAIGESGAFFPNDRASLKAKSLRETEQAGAAFAASLSAATLGALRAKTAAEVLQAAVADPFRFAPNLDGYFLPGKVPDIYAAGKQSHVPLLAGWNADEGKGNILYAKEKTTAKSSVPQGQAQWGDRP